MNCFKMLDWDSDFFGFPVAQLLLPQSDIKNCLDEMRVAGIKLAYCSGKFDEEGIAAMVALGGKYVDQKTIFHSSLSEPITIPADPRIVSYKSEKPDKRLIQLAIEAGIFSRFNTDKQIGKEKFEELYTRWISQSVSRTIAKEVLVCIDNGMVQGMITLGEKNGSGNIGLIAVDSQMRGSGIGVALVNEAKRWFLKNGYTDATVVTQGFNKPACRLYEKCGFTVYSSEAYFHFWL